MKDIKNLIKNSSDHSLHGEITLRIISGKWKFRILNLLIDGPKRFNEMQKLLKNISPRTLTNQLKKLECYKIIERVEYYQIPPKVEYSLSNKGKTLIPTLGVLTEWGMKYRVNVIKEL